MKPGNKNSSSINSLVDGGKHVQPSPGYPLKKLITPNTGMHRGPGSAMSNHSSGSKKLFPGSSKNQANRVPASLNPMSQGGGLNLNSMQKNLIKTGNVQTKNYKKNTIFSVNK